MKNNWQTKKLDETVRTCMNCGSEKEEQFCNKCNSKTPTLVSKVLSENISLTDSLRNLMKSGEKINGKPKREVEQYVGNKYKDVISEFERIRSNDKTTVMHRLWRRFNGILNKVHEHEK